MKNKYDRLREWRFPFSAWKIKATITNTGLYFHLHDYSENRGRIWELGFWENGEWYLRDQPEVYNSEHHQKLETRLRRIFIIVMRRYAARIGQLQRIASKIKLQ